jgi:hypothetical protein
MSPDEVQEQLNVRPFVTLRLHLSNGRYHDIVDPMSARVGLEALVIGIYPEGQRFPRWKMLSIININEIEPLTPAQLG